MNANLLKSQFCLYQMMTNEERWNLYRRHEPKCFITDLDYNAYLILCTLKPPTTMEDVYVRCQSASIVGYLMEVLNTFDKPMASSYDYDPAKMMELIEEIATKMESCRVDHYDGPDLAEACYLLQQQGGKL